MYNPPSLLIIGYFYVLSYRHAYHAGNFGDVLKHIVLVEILEYMIKKDKPFEYIDTHAGAGLYGLTSSRANKTAEYQYGIQRVMSQNWPEIKTYKQVISQFNESLSDGSELKVYPGSPCIAGHYLRKIDRAWLHELHPEDHKKLSNYFSDHPKHRRIRVAREDGFAGLLALVPPASRRALALIDPSYEVKKDYELVVSQVVKSYKKFPTGVYGIWYPVVDRQKINHMESKFIRSGIKNIQRFELAVERDLEERGMTSSGMIIINPPWTLMATMSELLPKLTECLAKNDSAFYLCDTLVEE